MQENRHETCTLSDQDADFTDYFRGRTCTGGPGRKTSLDFDVRRLGSDEIVNLKEAYGGKVVLIVNTASKCAFTGQYEGLEALYAKYRDRGLVVLGFPSNDFGGQEPGTEEQIKDFCRLTYSVKFPMFAKTEVKKGKADPLVHRRLQRRPDVIPSGTSTSTCSTARAGWWTTT